GEACSDSFPSRYASNCPSAAKNRSTSLAQGSGCESFHTPSPLAIESAQSNRSPICASNCSGVRAFSGGWNLANDSGTSRSTFPARYAIVARQCLNKSRALTVSGIGEAMGISYARFNARLNEPFSASIFFCSCKTAYSTASGRGGHPGTYTSTGITWLQPCTIAKL